MWYFNLDMRSHQSKGFKCFSKHCGATLASLFWIYVSKLVLFPYLNSWKSFVFVSGFIPSCSSRFDLPRQCYTAPHSICSCARLAVFPHMFWPRGWSVRIALFIFEWQCAMSNRWWCTKPANPEARGKLSDVVGLESKGQRLKTQSDPSLSLNTIIQRQGWGGVCVWGGQRYRAVAAPEMRRVLGPQWVVLPHPPPF